MSGTINIIKNHKKPQRHFFLLLIISAVLLVFRMYIPAAMIITAAIANELVVRKMNKQKAPFWKYSKIRNVDYLVIGDIGSSAAKSVAGRGTSVIICLPGCTLAGAYEVLRHTFSILKENGGTAVLAVRKKNINKTGYSPFEISFFHSVTINRLRLKNANIYSRFPIVATPVRSLIFLFGIGNRVLTENYYDKEITDFSSERGVELKLYCIP